MYTKIQDVNRSVGGKLAIVMLQETHSATDPNYANTHTTMSKGTYSRNPDEKGGVATLMLGRYYGTRLCVPKESMVYYDTIALARYLYENVMVTTVNVYIPPVTTKEFRRKLIQQIEYIEAQCKL